jgi:hypothetical protein
VAEVGSMMRAKQQFKHPLNGFRIRRSSFVRVILKTVAELSPLEKQLVAGHPNNLLCANSFSLQREADAASPLRSGEWESRPGPGPDHSERVKVNCIT